MRLRLTPTAARQLGRILDYIAKQNPRGARRVQQRLSEVMSLLLLQPSIGPATTRTPRRHILASPYPYAITYRIGEDEIVILGIRHLARRPQ